jgi:type IV pilus assembly protein PilA
MNKKNGFTLVELMVVIVIIGVLAAVAIPRVMAAIDKARLVEAPQTLKGIATQQHVNYVETAAYATAFGTGTGQLGIPEPKSTTWKYILAAGADTDGGFLATAILQDKKSAGGLTGTGVATVGSLSVNANDDRRTVGAFTTKPDWDNSPTP